jgi:hypothetical protein
VKSLKEKLTVPVTVLFCVLAAMALCMSFAEPTVSSAAQDSLILNIMENLRISLDGTGGVLSSFVATALFFLWRHNRQHSDRRYVLLPIVCFCLAVVWLMSQGFDADNTLQALTSSYGQMFKSLIYLLGSAWFLTQLGIALDIFIENRYDLKPSASRLSAFWQRHSFLCPTVLILLSCILPVIPAACAPTHGVRLECISMSSARTMACMSSPPTTHRHTQCCFHPSLPWAENWAVQTWDFSP